jgi:hypothetical protein
MRLILLTLVVVVAAPATSRAHFVFVVPQGSSAQVLLSETLTPDAEVDIALIAGTRLSLRQTDGREIPLSLQKEQHRFLVSLPAGVRGTIHGLADLGVMTRPGAPAHWLLYHPKTIIGDSFAAASRLKDAPVEIVPVSAQDGFQLQLFARGRPFPHAEITIIGPDGAEGAVRTDSDSRTGTFRDPGRYGAWARYWDGTPGQRQGQRYEEVRHYATLVFDAAPPAGSASSR